MTEQLTVDLPSGEVAVTAVFEGPAEPWAAMAVAHGAGAGYGHPFLVGFTRGLNAAGVATLRFNFPYVEAGRRMPGPAPQALATWQAADEALRRRALGAPVWAAGKSYGGRMASMAAAEGLISPAGLVYLGYPLHPPGRPEKPRVAHLPEVVPPQLFVSGTNDPFVDPHVQLEAAVASCQDAELRWIDGGNHSFEVKGRKRPADEIGEGLADVVVARMRARSAA